MTQVNSAQLGGRELALRSRADGRSLARRRADFAAQMRAMALSDLKEVADRLDGLHKRLEQKDGRRWTQQDLAAGIGIPYRTYQAWAGGKNENRSGDGYDKIVRFYRRKLSDKTITRNWLVFGDESGVPSEGMEEQSPDLSGSSQLEAKLDRILRELSELKTDLGEIGTELARHTAPGQIQPPAKPAEGSPEA